jgi:hypothetical protein
MMKQHDQQVLTAMQPVIDILEKEYLEAEEVLRSTGKYGWLADVLTCLNMLAENV